MNNKPKEKGECCSKCMFHPEHTKNNEGKCGNPFCECHKSKEEREFDKAFNKFFKEKDNDDWFAEAQIKTFIKDKFIPRSKLLEIVGEDRETKTDEEVIEMGSFNHEQCVIIGFEKGYNLAKAEIRAKLKKL